MRNLFLLIIFIIFTSCKEDILPKPKGYLSLNYPKNSYNILKIVRPYSFKTSEQAIVKNESNNWLKIVYPALKATVNITYRPVENNLKEILTEAEKLVYEHAVKAEEITTKNFENFDIFEEMSWHKDFNPHQMVSEIPLHLLQEAPTRHTVTTVRDFLKQCEEEESKTESLVKKFMALI